MSEPKVVAEWGQTANASHETAAELLDQCATAGAWGIKVQWLTPETIATADAAPYWSTSRYADTQQESFRLAGIRPPGWWLPIRTQARKRGVKFIASVFDLEAVEAAVDLDIDAIKIASGDLTTWELLDAAARTGKDLIISTGAANPSEIVTACETVHAAPNHGRVTLLACSLVYPCPPQEANLARIGTLRRLAEWSLCADEIGYSDHTITTSTGGLAVAAGATVLEKHVRPFIESPNVPDNDMALAPYRLADYISEAERAARYVGSPTLTASAAELPAHRGARRAWYATRDLEAGHTIQAGDLAALRPWHPTFAVPDHDPTGGTITKATPAGQPVYATVYTQADTNTRTGQDG